MAMIRHASALSRNYTQRLTYRPRRGPNSIPKWTLMTSKDKHSSNKEKTRCNSRRKTKRLTGPCYKTRCSASTTCTFSTRSITARTTFISKRLTHKYSKTRRIWTWRPMEFNRVRRGSAEPADITRKVAPVALT